MLVSATTGVGIAEVADRIAADHATLTETGGLARLRARQRRAWLWSEVTEAVTERFRADPVVAARLAEVEAQVAAGTIAPVTAAHRLLDDLDRNRSSQPDARSESPV